MHNQQAYCHPGNHWDIQMLELKPKGEFQNSTHGDCPNHSQSADLNHVFLEPGSNELFFCNKEFTELSMIYCDIFKVPSIHQESTHCILFNFLICKIIKLHFSA